MVQSERQEVQYVVASLLAFVALWCTADGADVLLSIPLLCAGFVEGMTAGGDQCRSGL